jgi:FkbM family methyltransferase
MSAVVEALTGKYYSKEGLIEVPLAVHKRTGLYYRPDTSDAQMIQDATKKDYGSVDTKGKVVFDLGSNIGGFILKCAEEGATMVIAYEPEPYNLEVLRLNAAVIQQKFPNIKIVVKAVAVGNQDGQFDLVLNPGSNSACSGSITSRARSNRVSVPVTVVNFADELEEFKPNLIKMDIEGAEYMLLENELPDYVKEIAMELHGFSKENSAKMRPTYDKFKAEWTEVWGKEITVFNSTRLITAHFKR